MTARRRPIRDEDARRDAGSAPLLYESEPALAGLADIVAGLTPAELHRVATAGHPAIFATGDVIFRQGDAHAGIFVLQSGSVRSFYVGVNGREITLANWGPGNFVGGPDIFGDGPHVWSGVATAPGAAIRLPGPVVRHLMCEIPAFAIGLVHGLAFKGKCYSTLLQMLGTRSVTERLALVLVNLATSRGRQAAGGLLVSPAPTHEELAGTVGATRQWVSATVERFKRAGLIEAGDRRLVVLDRAALAAIAQGGGPER
jgi:CRP-like cAMP-binding protein